jgi:allatostatin receptor
LALVSVQVHYLLQIGDQPVQMQSTCAVLPEYEWAYFQIPYFILSFLLPLIMICVFYICILRRLWSRPELKHGNRRRREITQMIFLLVLVFAVCWFPIQVRIPALQKLCLFWYPVIYLNIALQIILVLKSLNKFPLTTKTIILQIISHILAYTNSCINPVLYAFLSEQFQKSFRKIFKCARQEPENQLRMRTITATT